MQGESNPSLWLVLEWSSNSTSKQTRLLCVAWVDRRWDRGWTLAAMFPFPSPFQETIRELGVSFYNVGTRTFAFSERRRSRNVEHGNGNVGHVPIPKLLSLSHNPSFGRSLLDSSEQVRRYFSYGMPIQRLSHSPSFSCSLLNSFEQVRCYFSHGMPIQPSICLEQDFLPIFDYCINCNIEEGPGYMRNSDWETGPRPFSICLLSPQPSNPKCLAQKFKIMNPKATIFKWFINKWTQLGLTFFGNELRTSQSIIW